MSSAFRRLISVQSMRGNPIVLASALAIFSFASSFATPYVSPYFLLLGGNETLLGTFWAVYSFLNLLVVLPGGYVADVMGRKRILVLMTGLTAMAFLLFSASPFWLFLFIPQALIAFSGSSGPAREAILADSMPERRRSTGFAMVFALSSVGWTLGPLVGGYLYDNGGVWGMRIAFMSAAIGVSIAAIVYHRFLKETLLSGQEDVRPQQSLSLSQALRGFPAEMRSAVAQMRAPAKRFLVGYMLYEASGAVISAYWSILLLYAMGFSGIEFGFIELAAGVCLIAFSIPLGRLSDKIGRPKAALLITTLSALTLTWAVNSHLFIEVLLIGSLLDVFDPRSSIHGLRADVISQHVRGRVVSLLSVAGYAMATISVSVGGWLYTIEPRLPFYFSAIYLIIGGVFFAGTGNPDSNTQS